MLIFSVVLQDLLCAHPESSNLHIIPTTRNPATGLALSSRNAYLSALELSIAPVLFRALSAAKRKWETRDSSLTGADLVSLASSVVEAEQRALEVSDRNVLRLDYIELFDRDSFEPVRGVVSRHAKLVMAGAIWVGSTRLIDNVLLGWDEN